jgi:hypothetical protein
MTRHFKTIRRSAVRQHKQVVRAFHGKHRHAKRLLKKHKVALHHVRRHTLHTATMAGVSAGLIATPGVIISPSRVEAQVPQPTATPASFAVSTDTAPITSVPPLGPDLAEANKLAMFRERINQVSPTAHNAQPSAEQEAAISQVIQETFGITARAELEGNRLNVVRGVMAGEQHLPLYPGDTIGNHFKNRITGKIADPTAGASGMVPGLPSWGYFAKDAASVTKQDVEREQWYIAAQTFLAPGWGERTQELYKWFKYRKAIVINQSTGQACVVVIGDAGPSPRLDRKTGGSPEVLIALGFAGGSRKAEVITLFVDDPTNAIPLGPLTGYHP